MAMFRRDKVGVLRPLPTASFHEAEPTGRLVRASKAGAIAFALAASPAQIPMHAGLADSAWSAGPLPRCVYLDITRPGAPVTWAFSCTGSRDAA